MTDHDASPASDKPLLAAIVLIVVGYGVAVAMQVPAIVGPADQVAQGADPASAKPAEEAPAAEASHASPHWLTVIPFVTLLGAIAFLPLMRWSEHWWEHNRNRFLVAATLGLVTLAYYYYAERWSGVLHVLDHAVLDEYVPFIVLLFSLYTISGGIRIECDLKAHSIVNAAFILTGGLLASLIGTTGAAMLLIRPLLETNSERRHVKHTVVFFIFVVCNCGGCLLPIGDPPLFLGYLKGVDFWWTLKLAPEWAAVNGLLIVIYLIWDHYFCYGKETLEDIRRDETRVRPLRFFGVGLNGPLLLGVVVAVAFLDPSKPLPGTDWHPWHYLREAVQVALVAVSLAAGPREIRARNRFNYHAIVEVAALFIGIFICMQPALAILRHNGNSLNLDSPLAFFWMTGGLSSFLDNAPTYVVFFQLAFQPGDVPPGGVPVIGGYVMDDMLRGISLGAVFLGAMTYIGNGPNFMVKAIAEKSGVRMPSFPGYMVYGLLVLGPVLGLASYLFLALRPPPAEGE